MCKTESQFNTLMKKVWSQVYSFPTLVLNCQFTNKKLLRLGKTCSMGQIILGSILQRVMKSISEVNYDSLQLSLAVCMYIIPGYSLYPVFKGIHFFQVSG